MLRKYSNSRSLSDNLKLGSLTAFTAGMVNVASLIVFFGFSSNVTGHYAILAEEISLGNWTQVAVVFSWIFLFFFGNFTSNLIIINFNRKYTYIAHATPIVLEIICLLAVGVYGIYYYQETLFETEVLLGLMLFAMGLQNGLTASISNFAVKTTHLTGATTDLGILFSMFTKKKYREHPELIAKAKLLGTVAICYLGGAVFSGLLFKSIEFKVFYVVSAFLVILISYDWYKISLLNYLKSNRQVKTKKKYSELEIFPKSKREKEGSLAS